MGLRSSAESGNLELFACWQHKHRSGIAFCGKKWGNITDAVLSSMLKELMPDGMVLRTSYDEIPPRVEYQLTEKGMSVVPILQQICQWAGAYHKEEQIHPMIQCEKCDYR